MARVRNLLQGMALRRRLTVAVALAVAVAIVLASVAAYLVVRGELRSQVDDRLRELAAGTSVGPRLAPVPNVPDGRDFVRRRLLPVAPRRGVEPALPRAHGGPPRGHGVLLSVPAPPPGGGTGYTQVVTSRGRVLRPTGPKLALPVGARALAVASGQANEFFSDATVAGTHMRVFTTRIAPNEALQAARPLTDIESSLRNVALILGAICVGGVVFAVGLGLVVTRAALHPVARLTTVAEDVARTRDLSRRIEVPGDDEVSRLASTFNTMLAALEQSLASQRGLVADASHEMRTPLTSLRTNVEVLASDGALDPADRERLLDDVVFQLDELAGMVTDIVELARDGEAQGAMAPVRLDLLVAEAIERFRGTGSPRFELDLEPCVVEGAAPTLERAVSNLLDNAVKWSPPRAAVEVTLRDGELAVRDHGPGIAAADVSRVFDRFYRAPSARQRPGSGLGLAIVKQVAQSHGGSVSAANAAGGGALLRLTLPATRAEATRAEISGDS
jgi:two-component system sensor histidine kinase MprB